MTTALKVLTIAENEVGYVESPVNRTKYGEWYGMNGAPWCAMFLSWCFAQAGAPEAIGGKWAYTPSMDGWFLRNGRDGSAPRAGAIVFFDFPDSVDRIQHVGLVKSYTATSITTIEGNTSSGDAGSQSNGGMVAKRVRPRNASIVGYGYPIYEEALMLDYYIVTLVCEDAPHLASAKAECASLGVKAVVCGNVIEAHANKVKAEALQAWVKATAGVGSFKGVRTVGETVADMGVVDPCPLPAEDACAADLAKVRDQLARIRNITNE